MSTLAALLSQRAGASGAHVALSFKDQGVWRQLDWSRIEQATASLRGALGEAGFGAGGVLFVSKRPSAQQLLAVLAALSLGGSVSEIEQLAQATAKASRWAFARSAAELARLLEAAAAGALDGILFDDRRGASPSRTTVPVLSYAALMRAEASSTAPVLAAERCLLELNLASAGQTQPLFTSWLSQGFELGIAEEVNSVERDASELGVTFRVRPSHAWEAWAQALRARLAAPGSRKRRFVDWALAVQAAPLAQSRWARWVSALLVVAPLRRALGLIQWRRAVSLDAAPTPATALLLAGLGVGLEPWQSEGLPAFFPAADASSFDTAPSPSVGALVLQSA